MIVQHYPRATDDDHKDHSRDETADRISGGPDSHGQRLPMTKCHREDEDAGAAFSINSYES